MLRPFPACVRAHGTVGRPSAQRDGNLSPSRDERFGCPARRARGGRMFARRAATSRTPVSADRLAASAALTEAVSSIRCRRICARERWSDDPSARGMRIGLSATRRCAGSRLQCRIRHGTSRRRSAPRCATQWSRQHRRRIVVDGGGRDRRA